ncbi:MAG: hypothetical protein V5A42_02425, partial [Halofilum sp. (in: g-proteobacteria)]
MSWSPTTRFRPNGWRAEGLQTSGFVTFPTVVVTDSGTELTSVKAVGAGYPLRGEMLLADSAYGAERPAKGVPEPGTAWLDPRLFARLGVAVGDRVQVGEREFRIAASIAQEPD